MKTFARYFKQQRRQLVLLGFLSAVGAALEAAALVTLVPLASTIASDSGTYTDRVLGISVRLTVVQLFAVASGLILARTVATALGGHVRARMSSNYEATQRRRLFWAFLSSTWNTQATERGGQLQDLMNTFVPYAMFAVDYLASSLVALFSLFMMLIAAILVNWGVALALVVAVSMTFFAIRPVSRLSRRHSVRQTDLNQTYSHAMNEAVTLAREVRMFNATQAVAANMEEFITSSEVNRRRQIFLTVLSSTLYQNVALLLVIGGLAAVYVLSLGQLASLAAIVLLLVRALNYSQGFQALHHRFAEMDPYAVTLEERISSLSQAELDRSGSELHHVESLELGKVGFAYHADSFALQDISISARPGEIIGLVGPSGAGKSTLVQLIMGLREPTSGDILVNGTPLSTFSSESWFARIGFVPQEGLLLNASVTENIAFFRSGITEAEIIEAAKAANVHDDIASWPDGYATPVGERGNDISGGQRQRICIARALAGKPDMLVLDEPTSALDFRSEQLVQKTLERLRGRVLVVIVAHRLSTLRICDRIVVMDQGRLAACATHRELAETNSYFRDALKVVEGS